MNADLTGLLVEPVLVEKCRYQQAGSRQGKQRPVPS